MQKLVHTTIFMLFFLAAVKGQNKIYYTANFALFNDKYYGYNYSYSDGLLKNSFPLRKNAPYILFTPSIIQETKKGNYREFELKQINYFKGVEDFSQTVDAEVRRAGFELNHRYYTKLFKKKYDKIEFKVSYATSIGFYFESINPLTQKYHYERIRKTLFSKNSVACSIAYRIKENLLLNLRSDFATITLRYGSLFTDDNKTPEYLKKRPVFDLATNHPVPFITLNNVSFSLSYKLRKSKNKTAL